MIRRVVLSILLGSLLFLEITGCATACKKGDEVCQEKQSGEYSRPFYEPSMEDRGGGR